MPTAYRPDMLVRGVLKVSCGWVPGRGEVENTSTFLASAVDEPSAFTAKEGRSDGKKLLSRSPSRRGHTVHSVRAGNRMNDI